MPASLDTAGFDPQAVEGQVITVELAGRDVDLAITSVHPDGIEISLGGPFAAADRDGVHGGGLAPWTRVGSSVRRD